MMFSTYPLALRLCLNFKRPSSNVFFEELVYVYVSLPIGEGLCIFVSVYNISILGGLGVCDSHFLVMSSMCLTRYIWSMILLTLACVLFTIGALRGL